MADRGRELRHHGDPLRAGRVASLLTPGGPRRRGDGRAPRWIALLLATAAAVYLTAAACGCSASTPEGAVKDFLSARIAGSEEEAASLTVEGDLAGYMGGEPFLYASGVTYELEQTEAEGNRAVVTVHFTWDGNSVDIPYVCHRVGTKWKVALRETEELWLPGSEEDGGLPGL